MQRWHRRLLASLGGVLVALAGLVLYFLVTFNSPPFPLHLLEKTPAGSSQAQVREVLGPPKHTEDDGKTWCYSRFGRWPLVYIYFDDAGKLLRTHYDY